MVQLLAPECLLTPDHATMELIFTYGFTIHVATSFYYLAKGHNLLPIS